jgi:hypothetical protein
VLSSMDYGPWNAARPPENLRLQLPARCKPPAPGQSYVSWLSLWKRRWLERHNLCCLQNSSNPRLE